MPDDAESFGPDALDMPSNTYIVRQKQVWQNDMLVPVNYLHELSFRELAAYCKADQRRYDDLGSPESRLRNQIHNDPDYKPLRPGEGLRYRRRGRG